MFKYFARGSTILNFKTGLYQFIMDTFGHRLHVNTCQINSGYSVYADEQVIINRAVLKRRNEFSSGRFCAKQCLKSLGIENFPVLKGKLGQPLWPKGTTGSITHDRDYAIAIVCQINKISSIGIDLVHKNHELRATELISNNSEMRLFKMKFPNINTDILIFSLKESVIKVVSPLEKDYIDFLDIELKFTENLLLAHVFNGKYQLLLNWQQICDYYFTIAVPRK